MKVDIGPGGTAAAGGGGLTRQGSMTKNMNFLCSPTTHAGSFRCRLHRTPPSPTAGLQRSKSNVMLIRKRCEAMSLSKSMSKSSECTAP